MEPRARLAGSYKARLSCQWHLHRELGRGKEGRGWTQSLGGACGAGRKSQKISPLVSMLPLLLQGLLSGQVTTRLEEPYLGGLTVAVHCTGLWP